MCPMRTVTATLDDRGANHEATDAAAVSSPSSGLAPGRRLGPYELLLPLASGGMGHVWVAARVGEFGFRRKVAVKVMREELAASGEFRRRFLDEARLVADLAHTNVVETIDLGIDGDVLYQAMELVDGASLAMLLKSHAQRSSAPIEMDVVVRVVLDVLRGLHAVHELRTDPGEGVRGAGLVHRDVSTHNVLVGLDGVAKLTDFGIARATDAAGVAGAEGKLAFMAPEQLRGGAIDRRADVFAVGVVAWELMAGERLGDPAARLLRGETLPSPPGRVPKALAAIAMRALAPSPADRYPSAEAMADDLERAAHAAGLVVSPRAVASWAAPLASDQVARRNEEAETKLAAREEGARSTTKPSSGLAPEATLAIADAPRPASIAAPARSIVPFVAFAVGAVLLAAIALVAFRMQNARSEIAPPPVTASAAEPTSAPAASASQPEPSAAPTVSSPPVVSAHPPATHVRRPSPRPSAGRPAASVDPKYQNPYAR